MSTQCAPARTAAVGRSGESSWKGPAAQATATQPRAARVNDSGSPRSSAIADVRSGWSSSRRAATTAGRPRPARMRSTEVVFSRSRARRRPKTPDPPAIRTRGRSATGRSGPPTGRTAAIRPRRSRTARCSMKRAWRPRAIERRSTPPPPAKGATAGVPACPPTSGGSRSSDSSCWGGLDIQSEAEIDLVSGLAAADSPVLHRRFVEDDEDVAGGDSHLFQVADDRLVERPLGGCRSAWEGGDFHEGVVVGVSGWDLEVLGIVLDEPLSAIVLRDAKRLDQRGVNRLEKTLPLGNRPSLEDLDPHQGHRLRSSYFVSCDPTACRRHPA